MAKGSKKKKRIKNPLQESGKSGMEAFFSGSYGPVAAFVIISFVTLFVYSHTFHYPFHFDDRLNIVENKILLDFSNLWPPTGTRYLAFLSFAINYHLGGTDTFGYHLVNMIVHAINGFLVWWLITMTFRTPVMGRAGRGFRGLMPLTCALIFVSHPVQTQAVTYITQRFASLATLFYLLSLCLDIKARLGGGGGGIGKTRAIYVLSLVSAVFAMKTKEIAFTLPFIIILFDFTFFDSGETKKRFFRLVPFLLTLLIIPLTLLVPEQDLGGGHGAAERIRHFQVEEMATLSRADYLMTQFRVIVTYLRLLILPVGQNLDYDYPLHTSFFEGEVILSFLFLASVFTAAVYLLIRSRRERNGWGLVASFGTLWFFVTISIESSVVPIQDVIFEHRLYLPSVGVFMAFTAGVFYAFERKGLKSVHAAYLLVVISVVLSGAAYKRNLAWADDVTLWEDVVRKSPAKARSHYNLGAAYYSEGRTDDAIAGYGEAIRLKPDFAKAYYNLANLYAGEGRLDEAVKEYTEALRFKPDYVKAHNNLGVAYGRKGLTDLAMEEFRAALRQNPDYAEAHSNLGSAYFKLGMTDEAIEQYGRAIRLDPDHARARRNLALALERKGLER